MNFSNLFHASYWFKLPVIATKSVYWVWLVGLLVIAAAGLGLLIAGAISKTTINKNLFKKFGDLFSTMGIVGLIFFAFRQQSIPLFGLRIWFLMLLVVGVIWLAVVMKYLLKRVPEIKAQQEAKARKEKYLPGNN